MAAAGLLPKLEPDDSSEATPTGHVEPLNLVDLEERILQLCSDYHPKGISSEMISVDQPSLDKERMVKALQRLLSQGKIDILKQGSKGSPLLYRLKVTTSMPKGFKREENLVYQLIEGSGNKGIWIRDIKRQANMTDSVVSKTIKKLESKMLIKAIKCVPASKKSVYILYDVCPDETVTGGAWYSDQEFESEFVDVLNHQCLKFLEQKAFKAHTLSDPISRVSASFCSTKEVCNFITGLGISKVELSEDNIRMILDMLVYDGRAEVQVMSGNRGVKGEEGLQRLYREAKPVIQDTGFSRIPCGVCPVIDQCCDGGAISPTTCVYMKEWLRF